jgi:PmbA protein
MNSIAALDALLVAASRAGADAADALMLESRSLSVQQRLGRTEEILRAESLDIGLRVLVGKRQAIVSTSNRDQAGFGALAERAVAMARAVPEDSWLGLAEFPARAPFPDLDLEDTAEPSAETLRDRAAEAEDASRAVPGVTNSEGASASWGATTIALAATNGFAGRYQRTGSSLSATALAGSGTAMERDYDYSSAVHAADLEPPATIGRNAGDRAVARLNPRRPASARMAVVYDPRVSASLVSHLAGAVNGASVARGTSFLKDRMGEKLFAAGVFVHDDSLRPRGPRSRPFDGEGVGGHSRALVDDGVLASWLLDSRSARQLGLASTGHAGRGTSAPPAPSPTNLWMAAGMLTPTALMADITEGIYVTELIGMGVNQVTGDYSRGAAGFAIRNGQLAEPVSGITIAGNLVQMFGALVPANDLKFRRGTDAPTLRIDGMTIAGT